MFHKEAATTQRPLGPRLDERSALDAGSYGFRARMSALTNVPLKRRYCTTMVAIIEGWILQ